jgi:hypothetical protein
VGCGIEDALVVSVFSFSVILYFRGMVNGVVGWLGLEEEDDKAKERQNVWK